MSIPDYQTLMRPVLESVREGEKSIRTIIDELSERFELTPEEREVMLPSGRITLIASRVHWAKTYVKQAGLVDQPKRAVVRLTPRGRDLLASHRGPLSNDVLRQFPEFVEFQHRRSEEVGTTDSSSGDLVGRVADDAFISPEELIGDASRELHAALASELLERVRRLDATLFEQLIIELVVAMGYGGSRPEAARRLGRSGDNGVDGVIDQDALGLDQIYVQAKRYKEGSLVGPSDIRDFFGSLDLKKATKGLFVTASSFTVSARNTASQLGRRIVLIDGEELARLMIRHSVGCRTRQVVEIKQVDDEFFEGMQ
jgi:restriction system protein